MILVVSFVSTIMFIKIFSTKSTCIYFKPTFIVINTAKLGRKCRTCQTWNCNFHNNIKIYF